MYYILIFRLSDNCAVVSQCAFNSQFLCFSGEIKHIFIDYFLYKENGGFPGSSAGKESTCNSGDPGSIPGLGRSPGEGTATHYSGTQSSGLEKSWTWLSDFHFLYKNKRKILIWSKYFYLVLFFWFSLIGSFSSPKIKLLFCINS